MKIKTLLLITFITILTSCGNKEAEENAKRIHLEKIEVGKARIKTELTNELDRLKKMLETENKVLVNINEFQFGRLASTKKKQLADQNDKIRLIENYITNIEEEIALTNLRKTFEFQSDPSSLIQHVFSSAKNQNFKNLRFLCDPYGEFDSDAKGICYIEMSPLETKAMFIDNFRNGRIIGEPTISGSMAEVEIAFGPSTNRLEKIKLVKRMDHWYIASL